MALLGTRAFGANSARGATDATYQDIVEAVFTAIGRLDPVVTAGLTLYASGVHPYHRAFLDVVPGGTITDADQRWAWITAPDDLWSTWI